MSPNKPSSADRKAAEQLLLGAPDPVTAYCIICKQTVTLIHPEMTDASNNRWKGYCDKGHIIFRVA